MSLGPPIFILGAPRTGTTLLQRLLNSYDDVLIWGEHAGFLTHVARGFYEAWDHPNVFRDVRSVQAVLETSDPEDSWQAWMSPSTRDDWLAGFRALLERLYAPEGLPGKRYWGFKEIRYLTTTGDRTLDLLHALYPDAVFVFIVRNAFNAMASVSRIPSGPRRLGELIATCGRWRRRYEGYRAWHESGRIRSHWIRYEDLIEGHGELLGLLVSLGRTLGAQQHAVLRSTEGRWSSFEDESFDDRWRSLPATWRWVISALLGSLNVQLGYEHPRSSRLARVRGNLVVRSARLAGYRA